MPSQKAGIDRPSTEAKRLTRSKAPPGLSAASTPMPMPKTSAIRKAKSTIASVTGSALTISAATSRPVTKDLPKSPRKMSPSQATY